MMILPTSLSQAKIKEKELHILLGDTGAAPYSETAPGDILSTFNAAVLGQLIQTNKNFDLIPGHLESWQWDFKASEYVLKLKKGLKFHNGRNVTSKDLEFSLLRGFFSTHQSFYRTYLSNIFGVEKIKPGTTFKPGLVDGIKTTDNFTVRVKLNNPNPSFLLGLTGPYFSIVPIEELNSDYISWKTYPIGVGSYQVQAPFTKGVTVLKRVIHSQDYADTIYLYTISSSQQYDISIFESKDLDIKSYKKSLSDLPAAVFNISFSNVNSFAKNILFKKFIKKLISKQMLINDLEGYSVAEELLPKHLWGRAGLHSDTDIEEAKKILNNELKEIKTSGIRLSVFSGPKLSKPKETIVHNLQKQFSAIGVKLDYETSLNKFTTKEEAERCHIFFSGMVSDYIDPLVMFASLTTRGADPYARSANDEHLEKLYLDASKNAQKEDRMKSLRALSQYVNDKIYVLPLAEERVQTFYNEKTVKTLGSQNQPLTLFIDRVEVN